MQDYKIKVLPEDAGKRLDLFLADYSRQNQTGLSRQNIQKLISQGDVTLTGAASFKAHYKVKAGDEIIVHVEEKKEIPLPAENIPLIIVYEDRDLAVINKPCGLVVHPAPGNYEHTLVNALLFHFKALSDINPQRPGIVHRLDKETSGLLVIAKNNAAHLNLAKQFSQHTIKRQYIALVRGKLEFDENTIELPIGRHPYRRKNMAVSFNSNTKYAKTIYRTVKRMGDATLVELEPFTGRTHQLRVHLSHIGHPILGDTKYGRNNEFARMALHAKTLGFVHPATGEFMEFTCDMPLEFKKFINKATD